MQGVLKFFAVSALGLAQNALHIEARERVQQDRIDPVGCKVWPSTMNSEVSGQRLLSAGVCVLPAATMQLLDEALMVIFHCVCSCVSKSSNIVMAPLSVSEALNKLSTHVHMHNDPWPVLNPKRLHWGELSAMMASTGTRPRNPAVLLPVSPPIVLLPMAISDDPHFRMTRGHIWCRTKHAAWEEGAPWAISHRAIRSTGKES